MSIPGGVVEILIYIVYLSSLSLGARNSKKWWFFTGHELAARSSHLDLFYCHQQKLIGAWIWPTQSRMNTAHSTISVDILFMDFQLMRTVTNSLPELILSYLLLRHKVYHLELNTILISCAEPIYHVSTSIIMPPCLGVSSYIPKLKAQVKLRHVAPKSSAATWRWSLLPSVWVHAFH